MKYTFIKEHNGNKVYDVRIRGRKKRIIFKPLIGTTRYHSQPNIVFVQINETTDYYRNKIRMTSLVLENINGIDRILNVYECRMIQADIIDWSDTKNERHHHLVTFDAMPVAIGWDEDREKNAIVAEKVGRETVKRIKDAIRRASKQRER
jgi:hypothetical protein